VAKYTAKYPITRVEVKNITIPKDIQSPLENVCLGILPSRIVISFVESSAFNGTYTTNPFNFEHFNHNYLNVVTDSSLHITPLKPDYQNDLYIQSYNTLSSATGINFGDSGIHITRYDFANGYNFNIFDLTPDISSHEPHLNAQTSGALRIEVQFRETLKKPITAIVFMEYNNIIEIDRNRRVTLDYSA
jgi:hypothetical protein